jgi:hypothetical protein
MDIKQFVDQSLTQILEGITNAQKRNNGKHVAAEAFISPNGNLMNGGTSGIFTIVDFDISVYQLLPTGETPSASHPSKRPPVPKKRRRTRVE